MGEIAQGNLVARDFQGMATNIDPNDLQPGIAKKQVNVTNHRMAELEVRRGLRKVQFETEN